MSHAIRLDGMVLTLTERCNLRCQYCYVPVARGRTMTPEIADRAVDLLLERAADGGALTLSFFGGEPFLAADLMRRTVARARAGVRPGQSIRVLTPTNGLALSDNDLAWCEREQIELAISIDGAAEEGRAYADGQSCSCDLAASLPGILRRLSSSTTLARMTVTPDNVGRLCANLRAVARLGLQRIVYQPDFSAAWNDVSLAAWEREHRRLTTWLVGAVSARKPIPDIPAWRAIEARLLRGAKRAGCGAGVRQIAVTPDGVLVPCYRFAYADRGQMELGDVSHGLTNQPALDEFDALDPDRLRPELGECASCPAHDGCTHFCPALGWIALGDLRAVPRTACLLMQTQVAAVRGLVFGGARQKPRAEATPRRWAAAALLAATMTGASATSCNGTTSLPSDDGGKEETQQANAPDGFAGGICPVQVRADAPVFTGGGICPVMLVTPDASQDDTAPIFGGGICAVAAPDPQADADVPPVGGTCY